MEKIYIIVPVFNRYATTRKFIECLLGQSHSHWNLVLADSGSTDGTTTLPQVSPERVTLLHGSPDHWWSGSVQLGFDHIKKVASPSDVILLANDDITFNEDFLRDGVRLLQKDPLSIVSAQQVTIEGKVDPGTFKIHLMKATASETPATSDFDALTTRALFFTVGTLLRNGDLHPWLIPHYYGDFEWTFRAKLRGIPLRSEPGLQVRNSGHHGHLFVTAPTFAERWHQMFQRRHCQSPQAMFFFIWLRFPWRAKLPATLSLLRRTIWILRGLHLRPSEQRQGH